ncbi:MAG: putative transport system permease protein [Actinomycetota bacterium]|jgi:putative ABC transport system permease protein|nr:putative transport system permease protein [Actinomycetota bacterium]
MKVPKALEVAAGVLLVVGLIAAGLVPIPVAVLSIPFVVLAARRPVLRRLAVRNVARRPRETALILLGALLGTAIITGSAIVGDTLGASIRRSAFTQLGPVDESVRSNGPDRHDEIVAAVRSIPAKGIDGVLAVNSIGAAVAKGKLAEPNAQVLETDFVEARRFGGDPKATGIDGPTPAAGHAAITADLARTVGAKVGDAIDIYAYGAKRSFTVDRLLPRLGVAGLHYRFGSRSPNVFLRPGTIAEMVAAHPGAGAPPISMVMVSNAGGVTEGAAASPLIAGQIRRALEARGLLAQTEQSKLDLLDAADAGGKNFTQLFSSIGFFSVIAGILLLVSIFVMLADERKTELGMLRAVGLRRSGLVGSFSLEGWIYSLASAALGTIAGLGVGRAIVYVTSGIFAGDGDFALELKYTATLGSIQRGFVIGFVMSLVTVVTTSLFIARLNVIRAIRDLPNPQVKSTRVVFRVLRVAFLLVALLLTLAGLSIKSPPLVLVGPPLVALAAAAIARRRLSKRLVDSVASLFALVWAVVCFDVFRSIFLNPDISLFVVDGVVLTVSAVFFVSRHQQAIGHVVRRVGGGSKSMALRLGLAYPLARTFRTSIVLMTFALTMYTLVSITLFSSVFGNQIDQFTRDISGGFDGRVVSNASNPVSPDAVRQVPGIGLIAPLTTVGVQFNIVAKNKPGTEPKFIFNGLAGFDQSFVDQGPPSLGKRLPRFATEADVWKAVIADPSLVIVDEFFLQQGGGPPESPVSPGSLVIARDPGTGADFPLTVAALADAGFGQAPAYMGAEGVRRIAGARAVTNVLYYKATPGTDPQALAERMNGGFVANGVDAVSFRKIVGDGLSQQQQFFRLMQGYLALGLIVGVAGLGVVMVRAVRERRREVGILRSLGFETRQVRRAFIAESSFVALEGLFIGAGLAIISTWRLMLSGAFGDGLHFSVPYVQTLLILGLAFVATLLATAAPAQQASKIRPAVALRIAD